MQEFSGGRAFRALCFSPACGILRGPGSVRCLAPFRTSCCMQIAERCIFPRWEGFCCSSVAVHCTAGLRVILVPMESLGQRQTEKRADEGRHRKPWTFRAQGRGERGSPERGRTVAAGDFVYRSGTESVSVSPFLFRWQSFDHQDPLWHLQRKRQ